MFNVLSTQCAQCGKLKLKETHARCERYRTPENFSLSFPIYDAREILEQLQITTAEGFEYAGTYDTSLFKDTAYNRTYYAQLALPKEPEIIKMSTCNKTICVRRTMTLRKNQLIEAETVEKISNQYARWKSICSNNHLDTKPDIIARTLRVPIMYEIIRPSGWQWLQTICTSTGNSIIQCEGNKYYIVTLTAEQEKSLGPMLSPQNPYEVLALQSIPATLHHAFNLNTLLSPSETEQQAQPQMPFLWYLKCVIGEISDQRVTMMASNHFAPSNIAISNLSHITEISFKRNLPSALSNMQISFVPEDFGENFPVITKDLLGKIAAEFLRLILEKHTAIIDDTKYGSFISTRHISQFLTENANNTILPENMNDAFKSIEHSQELSTTFTVHILESIMRIPNLHPDISALQQELKAFLEEEVAKYFGKLKTRLFERSLGMAHEQFLQTVARKKLKLQKNE